jgi:nitronate monooxygenase
MALTTRLTKRLGIRHPLLLAPMGGAYGDGEWIERQFAAVGNRRVGCGFITWSLARRPEVLDGG